MMTMIYRQNLVKTKKITTNQQNVQIKNLFLMMMTTMKMKIINRVITAVTIKIMTRVDKAINKATAAKTTEMTNHPVITKQTAMTPQKLKTAPLLAVLFMIFCSKKDMTLSQA